MACELDINELIKNSIKSDIDGSPITRGIRDGNDIAFDQRVATILDAIGLKYGSKIYNVINEGETIRVNIRIPVEVTNAYIRQDIGKGETDWQRQNFRNESEQSIEQSAAYFDRLIGDNVKTLDGFLDSIERSSRVMLSKMRRAGQSSSDSEEISKIFAEIKSDPDRNIKMRIMAEYVGQSAAYMKSQLEQAKRFITSDNKEANLMELTEIMNGVFVYKQLILEYSDFMAGAPANPLKGMIDEAKRDMDEITSIYSQSAKENSLDKLTDSISTSIEKSESAYNREAERLKGELDRATPAQSLRITQKLQALKIRQETLAPSRTNIENHLIGKAGDSSALNKFMVAGAMNPDLLIQSFTKLIKDKMQSASVKARGIMDEIGRAFNDYIATGANTANIDESFKDLYVDVKHYFYNYEKDQIEDVSLLYFDSENSQQWRTEHSLLKARAAQSEAKVKAGRDNNIEKAQLDLLRSDHTARQEEYIAWRRENIEGEYGQYYQDIQGILDTVVLDANGNRVSPRAIRESYYKTIGELQQMEVIGAVPSESDMEEISRLRAEFAKIKTSDTEIGRLFTEYELKMKEMTLKWEVSPFMQKRFYERKAAIDKLVSGEMVSEEDIEKRDRWYASNTTIIYSQDYWERRRGIVEKLQNLAERMREISGTQSDETDERSRDRKDLFVELEKISKPYRDHNGQIDGRDLSTEETDSTRDLEDILEDAKAKNRLAYGGFLGDEFNNIYSDLQRRRNEISHQITELIRDDPSRGVDTMVLIMSLRAELRELKVKEKGLLDNFLAQSGFPAEQVSVFKLLYNDYSDSLKDLSELTSTINSSYYYDEYDRQYKIYVATTARDGRGPSAGLRQFKDSGKTYKKHTDGLFYEIFGNEIVPNSSISEQEANEMLMKKSFKDSNWYRSNHFKALVYSKDAKSMTEVDKPIYSWRISRPTDNKYIEKEAPNQSWRKRVIKDEFKNENKREEPDGMAAVKEGLLSADNHIENYYEKRAKNPALWTMRDKLIGKYIESQKAYPGGKGLGYRVPAIERDASIYDSVTNPNAKRLIDAGKRKFLINDQDFDEGIYLNSDAAGVETKSIPIKFRGRLESDMTSKNIVETIGKYVGEAEIFKARQELEVISRATETTLAHESHSPTSDSILRIGVFKGIRSLVTSTWNSKSKNQVKKRGDNQRLDSVREITNMLIYGETVSHKTAQGKKAYKVISNLLALRSFSIFSAFTPGQFMGNLWSQTVNLMGGQIQQIIKTAIKSGNARFTFRDYLWAQSEYARNSMSFARDVGKVSEKSFWTQFSELYDVIELSYIGNFGEQIYNRGIFRQLSTGNLAFWKNLVEHELFMSSLMAFSKSYHIDTPTGPLALKDAYILVDGNLQLKDGVFISDKEQQQIKGYMASLLRDINGNYSKLDRTLIENYWYGKTLLFMRKWMIPQFATIYGDEKYSVEQDRFIMGSHTASFRYFWDDVVKGPFNGGKNLATLFGLVDDPTMSEAQRDGISRTNRQIMLLGLMQVAYSTVLGYDDDDEDRFKKLKDHSWFYQGFTYSLIKAQSESSIFTPIVGIREANKMRKNVFANVAPFVFEIYDMLSKDIDLDADPHFFTRYKVNGGLHKAGDLRIYNSLWKLAGRTNAKQDPVEALRSFESNLNK